MRRRLPSSGPRRPSRARARATLWRRSSTSTCERRVSVPRRRPRAACARRRAGSRRGSSGSAIPASLPTRCTCAPTAAAPCGSAIVAAGAPFGLMPYGTEAMSTLRIEKGHIVVGPEADGRTTADDLGTRQAGQRRQMVHRQAAPRARALIASRTLATRRTARARTARRCRGPRRSSPIPDRARAQPDAGPRDVVVLQPQPRCVDRAGAGRRRARAARGDAVGGFAAGRRADSRAVGPPCFIDPEGARLRG